MNKLRQLWNGLKSSLWFLPALVVAVCLALAFLLVEAEGRVGGELLGRHPRLFGAGAAGSRGMLSAVASSMITVAGLTFSLTVVAITQASSQYTSRVLRNFMRDRANQFVLGCFVGVFAYCLVVLRTIRGGDEGRGFVPSLAVSFGLVLALVGVAVLIFFIHHVAASMQASSIISRVAAETFGAVDRLFPEEMGDEADESERRAARERLAGAEWLEVPARATGYIQAVDTEGLLGLAARLGRVVRMERGVGDFVAEGSPLVSVAAPGGGRAALDAEAVGGLNDLFSVNHYRTVDMDAAFGVRQLVDVALKALSPGVNDTTTAVICVDYLGAILARCAPRRIERRERAEDGAVRVVARGPTFASLVAEAFDQIRDNAGDNAAVLLRMLGAVELIARETPSAARRAVLRGQVALIEEAAARSLKDDYNRARVGEGVGRALASLGSRAEVPAAPLTRGGTN